MQSSIDSATNYERLSKKLRFMSARAFHANAVLTKHPKFATLYPEQVYLNYCISRGSVMLMGEAVRFAQAKIDDPVCAPLIGYLKKHIAEETGHDEWCADDLEVLGVDRAELSVRLPSPNVAALLGSQFYWMSQHHPVAFMGYLACIETNHPTVEYVQQLIDSSGLPAKAFDTLLHHARLDVNHSQEIIDLINQLPLNERHHEIIYQSAFQTFRYLALLTEEVCAMATED